MAFVIGRRFAYMAHKASLRVPGLNFCPFNPKEFSILLKNREAAENLMPLLRLVFRSLT